MCEREFMVRWSRLVWFALDSNVNNNNAFFIPHTTNIICYPISIDVYSISAKCLFIYSFIWLKLKIGRIETYTHRIANFGGKQKKMFAHQNEFPDSKYSLQMHAVMPMNGKTDSILWMCVDGGFWWRCRCRCHCIWRITNLCCTPSVPLAYTRIFINFNRYVFMFCLCNYTQAMCARF